MDISLGDRFGQRCLILRGNGEGTKPKASFKEKMVSLNSIPGLLKFTAVETDGETVFECPIGNAETLESFCSHVKPGSRTFRAIMGGILRIALGAEEYLLSSDDLLVDPRAVCVSMTDGRGGEHESPAIRLAFFSGAGPFRESFHKLAEDMLDRIDYDDEQAVLDAYAVYMKTGESGFTAEEILEILSREPSGSCKETEKTVLTVASGGTGEAEEVRRLTLAEVVWCGPAGYRYVGAAIAAAAVILPAMLLLLTDGMLSPGISYVVAGMSFVLGVLAEMIFWGRRFTSVRKRLVADTQPRPERQPYSERPRSAQPREQQSRSEQLPRPEPPRPEQKPLITGQTASGSRHGGARQKALPAATPRIFRLDPESGSLPVITVDHFPFYIGSSPDVCDICIDRRGIARQHIRIDVSESGLTVTDLGTVSGTFVGGCRLSAGISVQINSGEEIMLGNCLYTVV